MTLNIGQYIKWYEEYNDGIVKDAGNGVIIEIDEKQLQGKRIKIYRNKHRDMCWLSQHCLQTIGETNE